MRKFRLPAPILKWVLLVTSLLSTSCGPKAPAKADEPLSLGQLGGTPLLADEELEGMLYVVIDTPYQIYGAAESQIYVAAWSLGGQPADNAEVYLDGEFIGNTGPYGALAFDWEAEEAPSGEKQISVRWRAPDDEVREGSVRFSPFARTTSFGSDQLFVYTDRGIYSPGDEVQLRLIAWKIREDYEPINDATVEATLQGPDGQTITGGELTTDEFGIAWHTLSLADTLDDGLYTLKISWERAEAQATIRVERFVPPVIQIDHTLGRFLTADSDELSWEVELSYVGGGPLNAAALTTEVRAAGATIHVMRESYEGPGPHRITLPESVLNELRARLSDRQRFEIKITVEDELGRTDSLTRDITWAQNPYIAVIEADKDAWATGESVELMVRVTDVERVPLRDTPLTLKTSAHGTLEARTDNNGIAHFSIEMGSSNFSVEVFAPGINRAIASRSLSHQQPRPMSSHIERPIVQEREVVTVRVHFPTNYIPVESVVHMNVTDISGGIASAALLPITWEDDVPYAEGTFTAPSWGSMLLTFFSLGRDKTEEIRMPGAPALGVLTAGQNLAVHPNRRLDIQLSAPPERVEPGAELSLGFQVHDAQGQPIDASVGVAMVDEGVISLKDPLEITPMDIFYNPELRVISTTGSAMLTWPVLSRNWGGQTDDFALPPFAYADPGPVVDGRRHRAAGYGALGTGGALMEEMESEMTMEDYGSPSAAPSALAPDEPPAAPAPAPAADRARGEADGAAAEAAAPVPTITIRTEPPSTALWRPDLRVHGGRGELSAQSPDSPSRQQLIMVASDANGGVGVQRVSFDVVIPLAARSDLPPTMRRADSLETQVSVTNNSAQAERVELSLRSEDLEVSGQAVTVEVAPGQTQSARFEVEAPRAGDAAFTVFARGERYQDAVEGTLRVLPSSELDRLILSTVLDDGAAALELRAAAEFEWREATLRVMFPALSTAFAGADALIERIASQPIEALAGDLTTAILIYGRQQDEAEGGATLNEWAAKLQHAVSVLTLSQREDGGWAPMWADSSQLAVSTWCLEALLEAQRVGLSVPEHSIRMAAGFVSSKLALEEVEVADISFWEGSSEAVQDGIRAEAAHVLSRAPAALWDDEQRAALAELLGRKLRDDSSAGPELLALAHYVGAALEFARAGDSSIPMDLIHASGRRLVQMRREGHWEPGWFSAWGGQIEASVVILQILHKLDIAGVEALEREVMRSLMGTASSLGTWHNENGSAWLLRAIALFPSTEPIQAAAVVISVDGDEVERVPLDSSDPYASALRLLTVDLSTHARAGAAEVSVRLEGDPTGSDAVRLELVDDLWGAAPGP